MTVKERRPKVLIVDDDSAAAGVLSRELRNKGFEIWNAYNSDEAAFWVEMENFDVILVDLVLPGVSGYSVINFLRDRTQAPVFAITGYGSEDARRDVKLLGANDIFSKPFEFEEIISKMRSAIS